MSGRRQSPWSALDDASPLNDPRFCTFVRGLTDAGASDYSVARALACSEWGTSPSGRWHWRDISALRVALGCRPTAPTDSEAADMRDAQRTARLSRLASALASYDGRAVSQIDALRASGFSTSTIAAMLNHNHVAGRSGHRWCARSVRKVADLMDWTASSRLEG
jgi:hypothetical protein